MRHGPPPARRVTAPGVQVLPRRRSGGLKAPPPSFPRRRESTPHPQPASPASPGRTGGGAGAICAGLAGSARCSLDTPLTAARCSINVLSMNDGPAPSSEPARRMTLQAWLCMAVALLAVVWREVMPLCLSGSAEAVRLRRACLRLALRLARPRDRAALHAAILEMREALQAVADRLQAVSAPGTAWPRREARHGFTSLPVPARWRPRARDGPPLPGQPRPVTPPR